MTTLIDIFWFLMPTKWQTNRLVKKTLKKARTLEVTSDGFVISSPYNSSSDPIETIYKWKDIDNIQINNERVDIFCNNKIIETLSPEISNHHVFNYYEFIQQIPSGYNEFDYDFVESFFKNLTGCVRCGMLAMKEEKCLCCGFQKWPNKLSIIFDSEEEYIREEQFLLFEPMDDEEIDINNNPEGGFQSDPTWIPVIKEEDYKDSIQ